MLWIPLRYRLALVKCVSLLFTWIIYQSPVGAQNSIDSLNKVWQNVSSEDTTRLNAVLSLVTELETTYGYDTAFSITKKMLDFAKENGRDKYTMLAYHKLGRQSYYLGDNESCINYYYQALGVAKDIEDSMKMADLYNGLGVVQNISGNYQIAIDFQQKALEIYQRKKSQSDVARTYEGIARIRLEQGENDLAISHFVKSLQIREMLGDSSDISVALANMGMIYIRINEYDKAKEFIKKSMKYQLNIGDKRGYASSLNNLGIIANEEGDVSAAIQYTEESLKIHEEINDVGGIARTLNGLGNIYLYQDNFEDALKAYKRCLKICEELNIMRGIMLSYNNIALVYFEEGRINESINYSQKSLNLAVETGNLTDQMNALKNLYNAYKKVPNYNRALEMYERYIGVMDSLESESNQKEIIRQEYKYQYEKQAVADSIKSAEAAKLKDAQLAAERAESKRLEIEGKQKEDQKYYLLGGLILALIFGGVIFSRYRLTNRQKNIIESQKEQVDHAYAELDEKNTEILDSINYAKRIQSAILPPDKLVKEYLVNSFILYKPKDIVAGDFYWMEVLPGSPPSEEVGNTILFAAADCTGHGVPGAMVSVVCNNGLNRAVREHGLTAPGAILDKTREIVIREFEKSEDEVKDGMDIALCSLTFAQSEKHSVSGSNNSTDSEVQDRSDSSHSALLRYAGAHNPLWIIRGDSQEVEEIKADKQPIGRFDQPSPYTTHTIELNTNDSFYIFSDGYADQFGGDKGKKLKAKNFKALLLSIQHESMERQRELIDKAFEDWRGDYEQLDDVCVIGVRV